MERPDIPMFDRSSNFTIFNGLGVTLHRGTFAEISGKWKNIPPLEILPGQNSGDLIIADIFGGLFYTENFGWPPVLRISTKGLAGSEGYVYYHFGENSDRIKFLVHCPFGGGENSAKAEYDAGIGIKVNISFNKSENPLRGRFFSVNNH